MTSHSFEAILSRPEGVGTWTYLNIPAEVSKTFSSNSQVRVKGTINGHPFRSTALPSGEGSHYLVVGRDIREQVHAQQGDIVQVTLEIDLDERRVEIPGDLAQALSQNPEAQLNFQKMSYSHQKEYVDWIQEAKKVETRQRRIEKTIDSILAGKNIRQVR